ncbi:HD domain-containing protein [Oxalobacteraceae bacterium OM1]|nr:HD domain-containing protein [Oxalobacteraceae bacterium OM1]
MQDRSALSHSGDSVSAYVEVIGGAGIPSSIFALHDEVVIGREQQDSLDTERFLCIPEHTISRRHARIRRRGETFYLEDLHSFNGSFILGNRLRPGIWYPLRDGDEFSVSGVPLIFHSLVVPAQDSMPTVITKVVDASELTRIGEPPPDIKSAKEGDVERVVRRLHAMAQVSIALGVVRDQATLTEKIMNFIFELFPQAERAFILLRRTEGEPPVPVAARRRDGTVEDPERVVLSRTIVRQVLERKQSVLSVDTLSDRHFGAQVSILAQAIRSVMCVPLLLAGECLGLIQVDTSSDPTAFTEQDLEMLTGVCAETAVALRNFQLYTDIEKLLDGFVRASVQAIEERDPATAGHSFRVANFAEQLARSVDRADAPPLRHVSFSKDQLRELRYAALLHDFGKVGVREHVLRKEKKLHSADMRLLEQRFKYAQACLERRAYRRLADLHAERSMTMEDFLAERAKIEADLQQEVGRLEHFLAAIRRANEPAISHTAIAADLHDMVGYCYPEGEGVELPLVEEPEFLALSVAKGCLTPEERAEIESHVVDSYSFLILIPWTRDLAQVPAIAHGHHEKLDGSGYPMGLRGSQISTQTRILTICDIYDALTAGDRPYKKALPAEQALDIIAAECRAGHVDGTLFDVFVESRAWQAA